MSRHGTRRRALPEMLRERFDPVLVILSPPRCGSTAVARSFWQHPAFRWYVHEPCDRLYHRGAERGSLAEAVDAALDRRVFGPAGGRGAVIKEMTFQAGGLLPELLWGATMPVVLTVRDPRLALWSRMRQRAKAGLPPAFPAGEGGWEDLRSAVTHLRKLGTPYAVVEVTRLRARPEATMRALCERLDLPFRPGMLSWPALDGVPLGQLGGEQAHWYTRALGSTGFQPPDERVTGESWAGAPAVMRRALDDALAVYQEALDDPRLVDVP